MSDPGVDRPDAPADDRVRTVRPPKTFGRATPSHRQRFGDMSVATLTALLDDTLDSGYRAAAARRTGSQPTSRRAGALIAIGVLIAGVILGVAYRNTDRALPDQVEARQSLVERITDRRVRTETLQAAATGLRQEVTTTRNSLLGQTDEGSTLLAQVTELEYASAEVAVTGPGVRVTVGDPPPPEGVDPVGGQAAAPQYDALILDRDLQLVCNALWNAGAQAISVNGQRLGPTTAIRQAGGAVLVDFLPVASPYLIEAIGEADTLTAGFAGSAIGRKLATYRNVYDAQLQVDQVDDLTMKAALAAEVSTAQPLSARVEGSTP